MRNEERIPRILGLLGACWMKNPDLRLGQLINKVSNEGIEGREDWSDPFYVEDEDLERALKVAVRGRVISRAEFVEAWRAVNAAGRSEGHSS